MFGRRIGDVYRPPSFSVTKPSSLSSDSTVRVRCWPTPDERDVRDGRRRVVGEPVLGRDQSVERVEHLADLALRRVRALEEVLLDRDVVGREQQHAARGLAVAAAAAGFLRVRLERAGHVVVEDVADVRPCRRRGRTRSSRP